MMTDAELLAYDFFSGDKDRDGIRNHTARVVTTRRDHECLGVSVNDRHPMPAGTRARLDEAIVDGRWARFYTCAQCLTAAIKEYG